MKLLIKYDNKKNYKKDLPHYLSNPLNWSKNNATERKTVNYKHQLFQSCAPCKSIYKYNLDGFPVEEVREEFETRIITYQ